MSGLASLHRRIGLIVSRAVIALVNDAAKLQGVQLVLLDGEARAEVERFQEYGFTSVPFADCEAIAVGVGGSRSHMVAIATDDRRYRKKGLQEGEVALYSDEGDYVLFKRGRIVEVKAGTRLRVDAPEAEFAGNVHVLGNITCDGNVSDASGSMQEMRDAYNQHVHGTSPTPTPGMS